MNHPKLSQIKLCSKCRRFRPIDGFGKSNRSMDGLTSNCKICNAERSKKWREAHPEKWRAARSKWKAANPDKVRAIHRNTSHKRYRKKRGGISAGDLLAWENAQPKVCHWCGAKCKTWHVDHREPLSRGGEHAMTNLVIACPGCNMRKQARDPIEFAQSLGRLL